jgi:hypothetical protein
VAAIGSCDAATRLEGLMKVKRIVANIESPDIGKAKAFYQDLLGLDLLMDHG